MNIRQALQQATTKLAESSPSATVDAQVLLTFILDCNTAHLAAWPEKKLSSQEIIHYQKLIHQRSQGVPVAYLTGSREFWSLNFTVNDSTLIPRPETETLIEFILQKFGDKNNLKLLDMGTGTGAIAISIAREKPDWSVFASDTSAQALQLAALNKKNLQTDITLIKSDWFSNIAENNFDIIVSNPPYISDNDPHLSQGDVRFEPATALVSGNTGMDDIEHLCWHAKNHLIDNGWLIIEHGYNQEQLVADCFAKNGYKEIVQQKDLSGHTRMTAGQRKF
ncbi:MAG: peptide chain release factor N(5)-glutamine methyltransferase [Gammaproteobacteria bacterium]|nr:peptide chain release factor N(5)-glutamine methyltransferase [Gammaproteobacteria bacterium]